MSYKINKTDGSLLVDLIDGTINTESTDITLIGRNYKGFGELINENFVKMLENFASSSAPANPLRGQLWYDTSENRLKVYNGSEFSTNGIILSSTQPNLAAGDLWIDSLNQQLKFFDGNDIVTVGPDYTNDQGVSGFVVDSILDTQNVTRTVIKFFVGNSLSGVYSAAQFTPVTSQLIAELVSGSNPTGTIYQGFNSVSDTFKWRGVATKADSLVDGSGVYRNADSFLRTDVDDLTEGSITVQSNDGVIIGLNNDTSLRYASNSFIIQNNFANADIAFKIKTPAVTDAIYIDASAQAVGIFNNTPTYPLDVIGNVRIQGNLTVQGTGAATITEDLRVEDKTIELATITGTPLGNDSYVSGGGIVLKSSVTDKTLLWQNLATGWNSSEHINLATGKNYQINGTTVISATALGSTITSAPGLTSLGTLTGPLNVDNLRLHGITLSSQSGQNLQLQAATNIISVQGSAVIRGVGTPTQATDVATKGYVDGRELISLTLDVTGLGSGGTLNTNIATILNDLYPAAGEPYSGSNSGLNIPARQAGSLARVHTVAFGGTSVSFSGANLEAAADKSYTAVDQTITASPLTVLSVETGYDTPTLGTQVRITTSTPHVYEVDQTVTISGSAGISFDGTYLITEITNSTDFVIELAPYFDLSSTPGSTYTASTATVARTPFTGLANKTVLMDIAFGTATGSITASTTRALKQFVVSGGGSWVFDQDLTQGALLP
jgi:hypothetical protein